MADALEAVLHLVDAHNQQQQQQVENFNAGIQLFNQARQAAQANQLARLQLANQQSEFGQTNQLEKLRTANQAQQFGQTNQLEQLRTANQAQQFGQSNELEKQRIANQSQQFSQQNQLGQLQVRAGLAQSGLKMNPDGSFSYDPTVMNPTQQYMTALQGQSAAKTAGNQQAYQMYSGILNKIMGGGSPSGTGTSPLLSSGSGGGQSQWISPGVGVPGSPDLNEMLTLGQSSTTDPISGVISTSQNQVSLPAQAMQSAQAAQIPNQVAANKAATEAQTNADAGAADYKNIYNLASSIDKSGYLGNPINTTAYKISPKVAPAEVQQNITDLENSMKRSAESAQISNTATLGEGVAKRISVQPEEIGKDSTIDQVKGWVKSNIRADYYKEIATKQFSDELAKKGLDPSKISPDDFGSGMMKYWGKLDPNQSKELKMRTMSTLAPLNAAGFSVKTGKYYDTKGKEIK